VLHREIEPRLFPLPVEAGRVEKIAKQLEQTGDILYGLICSTRSSGNIDIAAAAAAAAAGNRSRTWNIRRLRADYRQERSIANDRGWSRARRRGHERARAGLTKAPMRKRARDAGAKGKTRSSDSAAGETGGNECLEGRRHFELSLHHRQNQIAAVAAAVVVVVHVVVVVVETLEKITRRTDLAATFVRSPLPASSPSRVLDSARFRAQADTGAEAAEKRQRSVDCAERFLKRNFRNTPISVSRTPFDHSTRPSRCHPALLFQFIRMSYYRTRTRSKRIGLFPGARIAAARSCSEAGSRREVHRAPRRVRCNPCMLKERDELIAPREHYSSLARITHARHAAQSEKWSRSTEREAAAGMGRGGGEGRGAG